MGKSKKKRKKKNKKSRKNNINNKNIRKINSTSNNIKDTSIQNKEDGKPDNNKINEQNSIENKEKLILVVDDKEKSIDEQEKDNKNNSKSNEVNNTPIQKIEKNKFKKDKIKKQKNSKNEEKLVLVVDDENKDKKEEKQKKRKKHRFLKFILIMIILCILVAIAGIWFFIGVINGWYGNDIDISKEDLQIKVSNSVVVDKNGEVLADLSGDEKRKIITLEDMADYLPKAYIAIEDERFYTHKGVDLKRTAGAILNTLLNGQSSYGGSTITQQLVKNITNDNESEGIEGIKRKIREWSRAYQVERMISKDQILELYLNILFVGSNNLHGVELGAEYYFNKSAKDLDLAQCAFLAGINHSPNSYNPYSTTVDNSEKIKNRTITVLNKMWELGYIPTEDEYNAAVAEVEAGLTFGTGETVGKSVFSYHTDAVILQVVEQVKEEKNMTEQMARNYVYSSGLTIHSTVDEGIQQRLEEEYLKTKYIKKGKQKNRDGTLLNEHTQSAMAIVDYRTGNVVAIVGGLGEKTESGWNRATQMRKQTGSTIKPLAVIAPGLEEKIITASTVYDDNSTRFTSYGKDYEPKDQGSFKGLVNIRSFISTSQNIPAVKIMTELTPEKSLEYLQKMGITSLNPKVDNVLSLALGGMTTGVSPLEMASAYGTIANDGLYITPTFYTNVTDSSGNVVLTPKQEHIKVLSDQNAYIAQTIIQEPVISRGGTATYCAIPGMDVAAKTGTTNKSYDRWTCGFTPYYAAATWYGYDNNETVYYSGNPAGQIWDAVMTDIHAGLNSATFKRPDGIVEAKVCRTTGCLAIQGCTDTYTEIFTEDNMPQECRGHRGQRVCVESGKIANVNCPYVRYEYGIVVPKETLGLWTPLKTSGNLIRTNEVCTIHDGNYGKNRNYTKWF